MSSRMRQRAETDAFLEEFPFVRRFLHLFPCHQIDDWKVKRIDFNLFRLRGTTIFDSYTNAITRYFVIGTDGEDICEVRPDRRMPRELRKPRTWFGEALWGETVEEAIRQVQDVDRIFCVLEAKFNKCRESLEFVVHKVPAKTTFSAWIRNLQQQQAEAIRKI